jgi:hypothetical protein
MKGARASERVPTGERTRARREVHSAVPSQPPFDVLTWQLLEVSGANQALHPHPTRTVLCAHRKLFKTTRHVLYLG